MAQPQFLNRLRRSYGAVELAAVWLRHAGYDVLLKSNRESQRYEDWQAYADDGDLEIFKDGVRACVEVKHRPDMRFQSLGDFDFPTVIVDAEYKYNGKDPKPKFYMIFNHDLTGFIYVPTRTDSEWTVQRTLDKTLNEYRNFYYCPLNLCRYYPIYAQES